LRLILREHHISFQRTRTWKESTDPDKEAKLDRIEYVTSHFPMRCFGVRPVRAAIDPAVSRFDLGARDQAGADRFGQPLAGVSISLAHCSSNAWATDSANDAATPRITATSVISVMVAAGHIRAPRRRRDPVRRGDPVNGCMPATRTSASWTGPMIEANCRSARAPTRSPFPASTTTRPRGTSPPGWAAALGSVTPAMCQSGTTAGITQIE
jgi:hypothetical protein